MRFEELYGGKHFETTEEVDGATIRRAGFELSDGGKAVERCIGVIIEEHGEPTRLEIALGPTENHGAEHVLEVRLRGEYALKFAELVAAAYKRLRARRDVGGSDSADNDVHIDIELQS